MRIGRLSMLVGVGVLVLCLVASHTPRRSVAMSMKLTDDAWLLMRIKQVVPA